MHSKTHQAEDCAITPTPCQSGDQTADGIDGRRLRRAQVVDSSYIWCHKRHDTLITPTQRLHGRRAEDQVSREHPGS